MSITLYDERIDQTITNPIIGRRYVVLYRHDGAANRTFYSDAAQLVDPPDVDLPVATIRGQWNPSGWDNAPAWATVIDGYAVKFTQTGFQTFYIGWVDMFNPGIGTTVEVLPDVQPDEFDVKVLWWDAAWLHTVFVCELSYSGTSTSVMLRASDVGTGTIFAVDVEKTNGYSFWSEYDGKDAIIHITPTPSTPVVARAVIIGDTR